MKRLIAVKSCYRDCRNGFNQAVRDTWLKNCPVDYRFFVGRGGGELAPDEEPLDCGDAYLDLPHKTRAIFGWVLAHDYDHAFLADTDTYAVMSKLAAYDPQGYDQIGRFNGPIGVPGVREGGYAWASGGAGYWMSRRAMEVVVRLEPDTWAEDKWIGQIVGAAVAEGRLTAKDDIRYGDNDEITSHFCSATVGRTFNVSWMYKKHREMGNVG